MEEGTTGHWCSSADNQDQEGNHSDAAAAACAAARQQYELHPYGSNSQLDNWQQQGKLRGSMQQQQVVQQLLADVDSLLLPGVLDQCGCFALAQLV